MRNGSAAPLRVLVAEDDAATARVLVWVLAQAGYDVEMALSGRATLDQLSASRYDVLICDWTMPDIDGVSIVRQVRQHTAAQPLIVLIAGTERPGAKEQALRVGADAYLAKPFEPVVLIDTISSAFARRGASRQERPAPAQVPLREMPTPLPPNLVPERSAPSISYDRPTSSNIEASMAPPSSIRSSIATGVQSDLAKLAATSTWRGMSKPVGNTLQECVDQQFAFESSTTCESGANISSAVSMVDVHHLIDLGAALFVSWNSGVELARLILHDSAPDDVAIRELLSELGANVLGTLKTALRRENMSFTLGLSKPEGMPLASSFARSFSISWLGAFHTSGIRISVVVGARTARKVAVSLRKARENMVLAEDLVNESGAVVLQAGTRLTSSTAERLAQKFPHRSINVCTPPAEW